MLFLCPHHSIPQQEAHTFEMSTAREIVDTERNLVIQCRPTSSLAACI
jgi:hypothetical protein